MKKVVAIVSIVLLFASVAFAKDYVVNKKAGQYDVEVRIERNPPVVGANPVNIIIKDSSGEKITDAKVLVEYSMPAMPGMPPMNYKTSAEVKGDEYRALMNLSMAGSWNVAVKISKDGKRATVKFNVDAH
jgi:hypothetical protein